MTTADLIGYYQGLLIMQYRSLQNAVAHVGAWVAIFIQNQIVAQVRDAFDVTTAIGAQLNVLGSYRGIHRVVFGLVAVVDWSLVPVNDPAPNSYFGWALVTDAIPNWQWLQVNDLVSVPYTLTDRQMRTLIQLRAAFQSSDGSLGNSDNILFSYFGQNVTLVDNGNMTITYQHKLSDPDPNQIWKMTVLAGILPHPAGVAMTVVDV